MFEDESLTLRIKSCGLKCNYLATRIGVSKCTLSRFLSNKRNLNKDAYVKLISIIESYERLSKL